MYVKDNMETFQSKALTSAPGEKGESENLGRKAMALAANEWKNVLTPQVRNSYKEIYKRDLGKLYSKTPSASESNKKKLKHLNGYTLFCKQHLTADTKGKAQDVGAVLKQSAPGGQISGATSVAATRSGTLRAKTATALSSNKGEQDHPRRSKLKTVAEQWAALSENAKKEYRDRARKLTELGLEEDQSAVDDSGDLQVSLESEESGLDCEEDEAEEYSCSSESMSNSSQEGASSQSSERGSLEN